MGSQTLQLGDHGILTVALELDEPAPGRWVVTYDGAGQVVKTEYTAFGDLTWRRLPGTVTEVKGKTFPSPVDAPHGRPVSVGPAPAGKPIPSPTSGDTQAKPQ